MPAINKNGFNKKRKLNEGEGIKKKVVIEREK